MEIKKLAVLGAGIMGAGIAQVAAEAGYSVVIRDIEDRFVEKGLATIKGNLDRAVSKGKLDAAAAAAILGRVAGTTDLKTAVGRCRFRHRSGGGSDEHQKAGAQGTR